MKISRSLKNYTVFNLILYGYAIFHKPRNKHEILEYQISIAKNLGFNNLIEMFEEIYSIDFEKYIRISSQIIMETQDLFVQYLNWFKKRFKIESFDMNTYFALFSKKMTQLFEISNKEFVLTDLIPKQLKNRQLTISYKTKQRNIGKSIIVYKESGDKIFLLGGGPVLYPVFLHEFGHIYHISRLKEKSPFWEIAITDRCLSEEFFSQLFEISFLFSKELQKLEFQDILQSDVYNFYYFHRLLEIRKIFGRIPIDYLFMKANSTEELYRQEQFLKQEYDKFVQTSMGFSCPGNFGLEQIGFKEYLFNDNSIFYAIGLLYVENFISKFGFNWMDNAEAMDTLNRIMFDSASIDKILSEDPKAFVDFLYRIEKYIQEFLSKQS
mgnify:CR=1 FL=1